MKYFVSLVLEQDEEPELGTYDATNLGELIFEHLRDKLKVRIVEGFITDDEGDVLSFSKPNS